LRPAGGQLRLARSSQSCTAYRLTRRGLNVLRPALTTCPCMCCRLYPEDVAMRARLEALLPGADAAQESRRASSSASGPPEPPGSHFSGPYTRTASDAVTARGAGPGLQLLSVRRLQQKLQSLVSPAAPPRHASSTGVGAAAQAATSTGVAPHGTATRAVPGSSEERAGSPASPSPRALAADPLVDQLRASLADHHAQHAGAWRPARKTRRSRLLAVRGVALPGEWVAAMRPRAVESGPGLIGAVTVAAAARVLGAIAGLLGLPQRRRLQAPCRARRVWVVASGLQAGRGAGPAAAGEAGAVKPPVTVGAGLAAAQRAAADRSFGLRRVEWL
jgi:hypothetical protein